MTSITFTIFAAVIFFVQQSSASPPAETVDVNILVKAGFKLLELVENKKDLGENLTKEDLLKGLKEAVKDASNAIGPALKDGSNGFALAIKESLALIQNALDGKDVPIASLLDAIAVFVQRVGQLINKIGNDLADGFKNISAVAKNLGL